MSPSFGGGGAGAVVAVGLPVIERVGEPVGGHGGHGGPDAEPAHHPIEDISRERIRELLQTADGPADLPEALVLLRADWIDAGGHTFLRHHIDHAGEDAQAIRCMHKQDPATGTTTDWTTGRRHSCGLRGHCVQQHRRDRLRRGPRLGQLDRRPRASSRGSAYSTSGFRSM